MEKSVDPHIRHVGVQDYPFLVRAWREVSRVHNRLEPDIYPIVECAIPRWQYLTWVALRELDQPKLGSHNRVGLIAEIEREPVGALYAEADKNKWRQPGLITVQLLCVDPHYQRQGVAGKLGHVFREWAEEHKYTYVNTGILVGNEAAQALVSAVTPTARVVQHILYDWL